MELRVDFYSKDEVACWIDLANTGRDAQTGELFAFACFALRQFRNLGRNVVSFLLAGILLEVPPPLLDKEMSRIEGTVSLFLRRVAMCIAENSKLDWFGTQLVTDALLQLAPPYVIARMGEEYLSRLPRIVDCRGSGKKRFSATWNPFRFEARGFPLGLNVNFYAYHSVLALLKALAIRREKDTTFRGQLIRVASSCARVHISGEIPLDQESVAHTIVQCIRPS